MIRRAYVVLVLTPLVLTLATAATAQQPAPLVPRDLHVSGVAVGEDSSSVRRRLGTPVGVDSTTWHYSDLDVIFKAGKVTILSITGGSRATRRGLRVGDPARRVSTLYRPCCADSLLVQICYD